MLLISVLIRTAINLVALALRFSWNHLLAVSSFPILHLIFFSCLNCICLGLQHNIGLEAVTVCLRVQLASSENLRRSYRSAVNPKRSLTV